VTAAAPAVHGLRWYIGAVLVLAGAVLLGVMIGPVGPAWYRVPLDLLDSLPGVRVHSGLTSQQHDLVWQIRMPRVVLAALVGGALSISGAAYQGAFRNPPIDPYLLGVAAGAGLGATIVFAIGRGVTESWPIDPVVIAAFVGGVLAVVITYAAGTAFGVARRPESLLLAGVAVVSFLTAIQTFVLQRNANVLRPVYSWILGQLTSSQWSDVRLVLPYVTVASVVLLVHGRLLDVLRVGDDEAAALGARVKRIRVTVVVAATVATASVVAVSGLIGFVGIIVPHIVRLLVGGSYRRVLPISLLGGAAFLILADLAGRMIIRPAELPIGVVTAFFGAPFFLFVLHTRSRGDG
jgi:iron complex transport system permease protein